LAGQAQKVELLSKEFQRVSTEMSIDTGINEFQRLRFVETSRRLNAYQTDVYTYTHTHTHIHTHTYSIDVKLIQTSNIISYGRYLFELRAAE